MSDRRRRRRWFRIRQRTHEEVRREVDEEIALHIEMRTRDLMARGMSAEAAEAEAKARFGAIDDARLTLQREAMARERRMAIREWVSGWAQDFRYSARALTRERMLGLVVVLTLALGLGANTVMFGIVDHLLLRGPAHVVDADEVRRFYATERNTFNNNVHTSPGTGYVTYALLRDHAASIEGAAAYYHWVRARIGRGEAAREVPVGWSTHDMFQLLGVVPHLGRFYTAEEDRPNAAARVAVIDHGFWMSEYGGAHDAVGRTLTINDADYTIIGVTPRGFTGPELRPASIWLPLSTGFKPHPEWPTTWGARWVTVIARLRPGVAADVAAAELTRVYRAAAAGHPEAAAATQGTVSLLPLHYGPRGEVRAEAAVARWLLGVSVIVLLIAVANVMNLLLARVLRRRREVSVRRALGISRGRLARLLLSESLLLALVGLLGALALAYWGGQAIRVALLPDIQWGNPLGGRTMLFASGAALLTGLLIGAAPVLRAGREDVRTGLHAVTGAGGRRSSLRAGLTVAQAALSVVLLVGAGLFVRSLWNVSRVDLGIEADRLLTVSPAFPAGDATDDEDGTAERERRNAFFREALTHLRARPDVEAAALAMGTPLQGRLGVPVRVPGRDSIPILPGGGPWITVASPGYFRTTGTRIIRGRGFRDGEGSGTEPVVVVNETMAGVLWPGEDALTKCLMVGDEARASDLFDEAPCARVVGIAQNAHLSGIMQEAVMQYYVPLGQEKGVDGTQILVRPRGDPIAYIPTLRRELHELDPGITYVTINPLQGAIDPQVRPWRLGATLFLVFGLLALLIAAIGLYSVMAYGVTQRRTEIGVRMALGARSRSIGGMIVREGVGLVVIGVIVGVALALAGGPRLEPLLFATSGRDPLIVTGVAAILVIVAVLASLLPAIRAARSDILQALRTD